MSRLLTAPELAAYLGITTRTLARRRAAGDFIPEVNIAPPGDDRRQPRFRLEDVEAWVNDKRRIDR